MPAGEYARFKRAAVQSALMQAGVNAEVLAPVIVPPNSRRRAVFKLGRTQTALEIGFHAARSHDIVDMRECLVITPGMLALVQDLRVRLMSLFNAGEAAELHVTETPQGFDLALSSTRKVAPALTAQMIAAVQGLSIARLVFNNTLLLEQAAPQVMFDGVTVKLPPQVFLQSTLEGEAALLAGIRGVVGRAKNIADLFAGVGTFALPLAKKAKIHAVEQDAPALAALAEAARNVTGLKPVTTEVRDLFKVPLTPVELAPYDAVVLDPPRAGAEAQARMLAKSKVPVIAYASCDAGTFARDAAILIAGGYKIGPVTPIDQFLWSSHIELVAGFKRGK
jgi:23S rRNA (uracil1939-C5)-methyltransferase